MNVPVTTEGGLTFEDGVSEAGKYVELRAEMDVLALPLGLTLFAIVVAIRLWARGGWGTVNATDLIAPANVDTGPTS